MVAHSANEGNAPSGLATFSWNGSVGLNFKLGVPLPFTEIWYYSQAGTVLPVKCALYDETGTLVPGTLKISPTWSGAVGSGWVKTTYDGSIIIPANLMYQANCYINGTGAYGTTGGNALLDNGDMYDTQAVFDSVGTPDITYVTGINTNVFLVDVGVTTPSTFSVSDNFNRADGGLGSNWTVSPDTTSDPETFSIVSSQVQASSAAGNAGSYWSSSPASDDQWSEIVVEALPGAGLWVAPAVRVSANGKNQVIAIAWNNGGTYQIELFKRVGGGYGSLGTANWTSAAIGDVIRVEAHGKNFTAFVNGTAVIMAQDTDVNVSWGQPGIASFSTGPIDNWSAGNVDITPVVQFSSVSGHVTTYNVETPINRFGTVPPSGPQPMRVLTPTTPSSQYAHAFLWLLPVEPGQGATFGDPIAQVQALGLQDTYNLTCIQPGFPIDPWYANNADAWVYNSDLGTQQETYLLKLVDWAKANLRITGREVHYLIGFSKSGVGGQRMFWRNQDVFAAVASWDFPFDETYSTFGGGSAQVYGAQTNFDSNYSLTSAHLTAWKADGDTGSKDRVWIAGGISYTGEVGDADTTMTSDGILHTYVNDSYSTHNWVSVPDWVGPAVTFLAGVGPPPSGGLLMAGII